MSRIPDAYGTNDLTSDTGWYGSVFGLPALPGPVFNPSDPQFGGRASFLPDRYSGPDSSPIFSMLSANADPTDPATWFNTPDGISAPYWIAVLGNLGPDVSASVAAADSQGGDDGSCPTIGGGLNTGATKWSIATFGPAPFPWPSTSKPLVANETYLMLAGVASGTNASFLEIDWRDASGTLQRLHQDLTVLPYACKEMFFGWMHTGYISMAGIEAGSPVSTDLEGVRNWAAPYLVAGPGSGY